MPRVQDASSVTRLRAIQSSSVVDPVKRSASYTPAAPTLLYSLRASDAGRGMFPAQSYLSNPVARGWVNPRHQGFITGPSETTTAPLPRILLNLTTNFDGQNGRYEFGVALPPAADFEAVLYGEDDNPLNVDQITYISIFDFSGGELDTFGSTTITTSPEWPGSTFTSSATEPTLTATAGTFPGLNTVITFRNVPLVADLAIQFYGNTPP